MCRNNPQCPVVHLNHDLGLGLKATKMTGGKMD